ncbi:MAG: D-alanyl-D-alanine carboxypeptidase [Firmicutes bacterium]|nr:D-alanyl-D-alanine carboxypeptidase [Bacillota bacterium]
MIGSLGGLAEYFSPSVRVDDNDLFGMQESVEASSLAPTISAEGAILINAEDGSVIYEKNADKRLYPASTTKIMTALIGLEIMDEINAELDSEIKVPKEAVGIEGSSLYLKEGEIVTAEELLYGIMLQSGNDGATALAISLGGNMSNFVERMNKKAVELGCRETDFVNPSGLFDKDHYTTARDLALISKAAMETQAFREIVSSKNWSSDTTGRSFTNKNKTIAEYEGATGVKIGYTKKSGRTLVASAKRGDIELIAVVLNAPNWFQDAYALLDYGFARDN